MIFILIFITAFGLSLDERPYLLENTKNKASFQLEGTWKTIPRENDMDHPIVEVIISRDSIFISNTHIGSGGYKQLLSYKISNDTIFAIEKEIMFFDQNIGYISGHYKYRKSVVGLHLSVRNNHDILVFFPFVNGGVLSKVTNDSKIDYNFDEQFSKWRLGKDFKCDYKKNGRPITSTSRHGGYN